MKEEKKEVQKKKIFKNEATQLFYPNGKKNKKFPFFSFKNRFQESACRFFSYFDNQMRFSYMKFVSLYV